MKSTMFVKAAAVAVVVALAGCTDLKPLQAQVDDLKSQVSKLQSEVQGANSAAAKRNAALGAALLEASFVRERTKRAAYLEIERLNMRSIFSLVASTAAWAAWAAASAWFAVLCAPAAAVLAA